MKGKINPQVCTLSQVSMAHFQPHVLNCLLEGGRGVGISCFLFPCFLVSEIKAEMGGSNIPVTLYAATVPQESRANEHQVLNRYFPGKIHKQINKLSQAERNLPSGSSLELVKQVRNTQGQRGSFQAPDFRDGERRESFPGPFAFQEGKWPHRDRQITRAFFQGNDYI